ncbi:MAG: YbaK/EbsC family protein [Vallitaleaceae bacterium]|jgi:prolyl-tRNA editing enzyme YbaK/EbsC (Cys-tRNA(Pro) deacylase)|nr:YbaK/EbsC family protein [Vallitaleaceae bacterium]
MAIEKVKTYFQSRNMAHRLKEFDSSSATVELAAKAAGCIPARIAKTLTFEDDQGCILIVTAGDARIDNSKFKGFFNKKATMLKPEDVLSLTGHAIGGVCPFAITDDRVKTYLDVSLKRFDTVFPAGGSSNSAIELTIDELYEHGKAIEFIDVCKNWQEI